MNVKEFASEQIRLVEGLDDSTDKEAIESTSRELRTFHYSPMLLFPVENFENITREGIIREIKRIRDLTPKEMSRSGFDPGDDIDEKKKNAISLIVHHYKLLVRLRKDEPEAWDEVNELYEDD